VKQRLFCLLLLAACVVAIVPALIYSDPYP
jgi:hypothetical protein